LVPVPGVGAALGAIPGGIIGGLLASYVSKRASEEIFDAVVANKCPLE
jgi:hypothetical protein